MAIFHCTDLVLTKKSELKMKEATKQQKQQSKSTEEMQHEFLSKYVRDDDQRLLYVRLLDKNHAVVQRSIMCDFTTDEEAIQAACQCYLADSVISSSAVAATYSELHEYIKDELANTDIRGLNITFIRDESQSAN